MLAHIDVHEPKPPDDDDSPLAFSMEGYEGKPPSQLISRYWSPGWNSVQALNKFQQEVGGPLRGGDPGKRLLEPSSSRSAPYFRNIPEPFAARAGEWLVVPQHHIFGSEELSLLASGIAHRAPNPYIALCAGDASRLNMTHGEMAALYVDDVKHDLEVIIFPDLPHGVAGLPASLCVTLGVDSPRYVRIAKGS